jgi:hypothetical protein
VDLVVAFVRLAPREALDGGPVLFQGLGSEMKPSFDRGVAFLEPEMDAGRLRRYDARQLVFTAYGAPVLSLRRAVRAYLSTTTRSLLPRSPTAASMSSISCAAPCSSDPPLWRRRDARRAHPLDMVAREWTS